MRTSKCFGFIGLLLLAALLASCNLNLAGLAEKPPPIQAPAPAAAAAAVAGVTYTVKRGAISQLLSAPTRVAAAREASLYFRTAGMMGETLFKSGDQVAKGAVLAELVGESLKPQLSLAQLNLKESELRLAKAREAASSNDLADAKAAVDLATVSLETAKLRLEKLLKGPSPDETLAAKAGLDKAKVALRKAQAAYDLVSWIGDIAIRKEATDLETATIDYNLALATNNLKAAGPRQEDIAIAENDVKSAEISLARAKADYEQRKNTSYLIRYDTQIAVMEVERDRLNIEDLNKRGEDTRIVAPFAGTVVAISAKPGDLLQAFTPVIRIADPSSLELVAEIDDASLGRVAVGTKAAVTFNQRPGQQYSGAITKLPSLTDIAAGDRSARLRLDSPVDLVLGLEGKAAFVLQEKQDALVVPRDAVRGTGNRNYVRVLQGDLVEQVEVRTGIQTEDLVELLSGVKEGDKVLGR